MGFINITKQFLKKPATFLIAGITIVVFPLFFYESFPEHPWFGRYAIPITQLSDGTWKTIFWIDFAVLALICFVIAVFIQRARNRIQ